MTRSPHRSIRLRKAIFLSLICTLSAAWSQNITETHWYFGNSPEHLVFDRNGRDVYLQQDQFTPFGSGGAVTVTDQFTGNLLFYTDGVSVYDVSHTQLPGGLGLSGNPGINVPVVTVPVTGSPGQYYLFTNSGASGPDEVQYTTVDATIPGNGTAQFPYGDVAGGVNNATGLTSPAEGMIVIPATDPEDFWLVTQDRLTFDIRVTLIDDGLIGATTSYVFIDGTRPGYEAAHFAFNEDSLQLAMAPRLANRNVWLMDFDPATGVLDIDTTLTATGFNDDLSESIYDLEWSPDGSKLYLSRFGSSGTTAQLYQIDFNDPTRSVTPLLPAPIFRSYGLQKAPDDRIYHLYQQTNGSAFNLGRINRPDSIPDSVQYQPIVFPEDFVGRQFPAFTPAYSFEFDTLNFYWIDSCATNITKFFPIVEPIPNSLTWSFEEATSEEWIPNYEFSQAGAYMVRLTAEVNGFTQSIQELVEIFDNDLNVDLGNDTTICVDEILTLDAGQGSSFVWNTGALTQTIDVDTTGTYWVEVTNTSGCTDYDEISVLEYGVSIQTSNQWYFGEQAGIEFTNGPIAILDGNQQDAPQGCATVSDVNGDLLFYTNGVTVWNRDHDVMVNGDMIGGDLEAAQNSLIMPFAGDRTLYYLLTTEEVYGDETYTLKYSIVDMKEDGGRGAVVMKDVQLMENSTERITGSGFTGNDLIITHEFGNNTFRSFTTSADGLSGAIFSPTGEVHEFMNELSATGYMKISPTQETVAVNIPGTNQVEIFDLDQETLSNPRLIDTGENDLYGMEYAPSGQRLYLSTSSASSKLIQYDLDSLNSMDPVGDITATKYDAYPTGSDYGALQLGPNGVIYLAVQNASSLGTINAPDEDDNQASFVNDGFDLSGRRSFLGLPNFAQNQSTPLQEPSMTVTAGCAGQESVFSGVGRDPNNSIENYFWIFGDGTSAAGQDTTHTYTSPGTYTVQLVLSNRCDTDTTLSQTITINTIPEVPTVPADTALCGAPILLEAWPVDNPDLSYYWSTGEDTRTIEVSDPAIIDVAIINTLTGCSSDTLQIFMADLRPDVDLGPDLLICQNDPPTILDSQVARGTYAWAIDGVPSGSGRTLEVNTINPGVFEYTIAITNSFGCVGRDTLEVTILEVPDITATPTNGTCGADDGVLDIAFNSVGSYSYELLGSGIAVNNIDGVDTAPPITGLASGNYTLRVTNLVTGCILDEVVQIEDVGGFGLTVNRTGNCAGDVALTISGNTPSLPASYDFEVWDANGNVAASGTNTVDPLVISSLDPATYFVEVSSNGPPNCVETEQIDIPEGATPDFTLDPIADFCGTSASITLTDGGTPGTTYSWSTIDGNIVTAPPTGTSVEVDQSGRYIATASAPGFCDQSDTIVVTLNTPPTVNVVIDGDPCDGEVVLMAVVTGGSGSYLYEWSDSGQASQRTITSSGTYSVVVTDQLTACVVTSADVTVSIEREFEVSLSLSPDCENSGNVLVIATPNYYDPGITYEWLDPDGVRMAASDSILTVTSSGEYTVNVSNESGSCVDNQSIQVEVVPITEEDLRLPERAAICTADADDPTVNLDPGVFNTYEWRLVPDETVISTDRVLNVSSVGTYEVTLYNGFTCAIDVVDVVEDCRPTIVTPNAFTPDGNGINDEFFVYPNDYVDTFEILIYTRWGELVYRSSDPDFRWDGIYRGQLLPPGTYTFILKFSSSLTPFLGTIEQYGSVTLIR